MAVLTLASALWTATADASPTPQFQCPPHLSPLENGFLNLYPGDWLLQPNVGLADVGSGLVGCGALNRQVGLFPTQPFLYHCSVSALGPQPLWPKCFGGR